jgi:hypothetical protein
MINIVHRNIIAIYSSKNELRESILHDHININTDTSITNLYQNKENIAKKKKSID